RPHDRAAAAIARAAGPVREAGVDRPDGRRGGPRPAQPARQSARRRAARPSSGRRSRRPRAARCHRGAGGSSRSPDCPPAAVFPARAGGAVVEVTDSGPGIAPEILPNLGEPFFTTRPEGTGLGLAIAKRYVEEAGGRLDITSTLGRGTTVRIWLPSAGGEVAPQPVRSIA